MRSNKYYVDNQAEYESSARNYPRKFPIAIESAKGSWVEDVEGNRYLDFLNGAGTLALGHNDDEINEAMINLIQSGAPLHMLDVQTPLRDEFVKTLLSILPEGLASRAKVQFCSPSGTDATDAAIKLCKTATGRSTVIAFSGGYHGMGHGPMALATTGWATGPWPSQGTSRPRTMSPTSCPASSSCPFADSFECVHHLRRFVSEDDGGRSVGPRPPP